MITDRQKVCKCGANVAELLSTLRLFEIDVKAAKMESSPTFKSSVDNVYRAINKIEDNCSIDADKIRWSHADIFNKVVQIGDIRDPKKFKEKKEDIIRDIDSISNAILQKITDCSK